ncbi:NAD(P)H-dependent flavin oxidoreductase [Roseivirga sp.]|uniref:NAD(P)H-dependent flavin oxidoreductase n=1 Tax=Roseivirga sp. TaxID=1964215 RepID=UPI003B523484
MWNKTRITQLLKIKYPIIQGPFGGKFSSVKLVSSVSNLGGMGSFGLNSYSPEEILEINEDIRSQTSNAYALNIWVPLEDDPADTYTKDEFEEVRNSFSQHFDNVGATLPDQMLGKERDFEQKIEALLKASPPVVSFIYGIPPADIISEFKRRGIVVMAVATTVNEALMIEKSGLDIVIASGKEAGGHRASFLDLPVDINHLDSTNALVARIRSKVNIPVIAAGGITTGSDIVKALHAGADAVQLGTAFLATEESNATEEHKAKLLSEDLFITKLTNVFTGRMARVIETDFVREIDLSYKIAPFPIQSNFLSDLRETAKQQGNFQYEAFWSGQPSQPIRHKTTSGLFKSLLHEIDWEHQI